MADATGAHTWSPCRLLPARPPLPSLARLPWVSLPSPGTRPSGNPMRKTSWRSGEAQTRGQCVGSPLEEVACGEEPGASAEEAQGSQSLRTGWAGAGVTALGCRSLLRGGSRTQVVLSHLLRCLRCPVPLGASGSLCVKCRTGGEQGLGAPSLPGKQEGLLSPLSSQTSPR